MGPVLVAELYEPVTGSWVPAGDTGSYFYRGHTATLLASGQVLVLGGVGGFVAGTMLYNP